MSRSASDSSSSGIIIVVSVDRETSRLPAAFDRADVDAEQVGRLFLGQCFVEEQVDDLAFVIRKRVDKRVEQSPLRQVLRLVSRRMKRSPGLVGACRSVW